MRHRYIQTLLTRQFVHSIVLSVSFLIFSLVWLATLTPSKGVYTLPSRSKSAHTQLRSR